MVLKLKSVFLVSLLLALPSLCPAKELTILYTGETHAMLYPCSCPAEKDGGVARRAALIRQLRAKDPAVVLLDSGSFFAGGVLDEYSQNTELDSRRSQINLKAMELMRYDALAIGDNEFNFGRDFLEKSIKGSKSVFLSCNIELSGARPYFIKDAGGVKVGITGVSPYSAAQKAGQIRVGDPQLAVKKAVAELKAQGAQVILLLSRLSEKEELELLKSCPGIDMIISGKSHNPDEPPVKKTGHTLIAMPAWQGRRLGRLTLDFKDGRIADYKSEEARLSDRIKDDPEVLKILPECFSAKDCRKSGAIGSCSSPGQDDARCSYVPAAKVPLLVINNKDCFACDTSRVTGYLSSLFPGLNISVLEYRQKRAQELLKDSGVGGLPAYFLGKEIENDKGFAGFKENLSLKGDYYLVVPEFSGLSYIFSRQEEKGKIDLFFSFSNKWAAELLDAIREFSPVVHFLVVYRDDKFDAEKGGLEVEDCLRAVCVEKYFPGRFWDYISCRAKNSGSSWWEDCAEGLDTSQIKTCARGAEGKGLLKANTALNRELKVMHGPTYLTDNRQIFGLEGRPTKEELKKIFKKQE
jgi:5'-nucleotidase